jgi:cytochrome c biogenesis protein CcdA/thiol-disulfide isomerase/thioredoxin
VLGLAATFTIAIVALAQLVRGVGLAAGAARTLAIVVLIAFGAIMFLPDVAARIQAPLSRLGRFGPRSRGDGFLSGLGVGGALGFVCAPCAGPILAAVTSVSASSGASLRVVLVAIAYALGLSAMLLLYALGGRALIARLRRSLHGHVVERSLGTVLVLTGVLMAFNLDVRFEESLARSGLPAIFVDPTKGLETSAAVQRRLASLRPASRFAERQQASAVGPHAPLPDLGPAPDFTDTQQWFNTPGGRPLSLKQLRGKVVLVDFWTYTCINCIRTLPFVEGLYRTYHRYGFEVVGVETPEFTFEQEAANVAQAIRSDGLTYPVVQDNRYGTWNAYENQYWPAEYLIDARGEVRHTQFGEGDYDKSEQAVRALLSEAGARALPAHSTAHAIMPSAQLATPETYLDPRRAQGFLQPIRPGEHAYEAPPATTLQTNEFALQGDWTADAESAMPAAPGAAIELAFQAAHVYLVLTSQGGTPRQVSVQLDGRPIQAAAAGRDVHGGAVTVRGQRLYELVALRDPAQHALTVSVPPGVKAYDFTFG